MFGWALVFLAVALLAAAFGLTGVAGTATYIAWLLCLAGLMMFAFFLISGHRAETPYS